MKAKDLKPNPVNPRKIGEWQLKALGKSMRAFGDISGVVVNIRTGNLVCGHQRLKHIPINSIIKSTPVTDETGTTAEGTIETPWGKFSYREVDWPEEKELLANIAANRQGGEFDNSKLKPILISLDTGEIDLDLSGFSRVDLELMMTAYTQEGPKEPGTETKTPKVQVCPECGATFT